MITHFHMQSGHVCTFKLDVEDADKLIKSIKPREIFKRSAHMVLGKVMMVTLNPQEIEWIEIEGGNAPKLTGMAESLKLNELSRDLFNIRLAKNKIAIEAVMAGKISPTTLLAYGQATFRSGKVLLIETKAQVENNKTRLSTAMKIFDLPALFVQGDTALHIVNPRNIAIWQVVPGMAEGPAISIKGEFLKMSGK